MLSYLPKTCLSLHHSRHLFSLVTDLHGSIIFANERVTETLSLSGQAAKAFAPSGADTRTLLHKTKQGGTLTVEWEIHPFESEEGEPLLQWIAPAVQARKPKKGLEKELNELRESAPVLIWTTDPQGVLNYVNNTWVQFTGIEKESLGKLLHRDLIHPDDREDVRQKYAAHLESGKTTTVSYRMRMADGSYGWVQETSLPCYSENGSLKGHIGSVMDMTAQKSKEERLRLQATALSSVSDAILLLDGGLRLIDYNKAAATLGVTRNALGNPWHTSLPFAMEPAVFEAIGEELKENGSWTGEWVIGSEGEKRHLLSTLSSLNDGHGRQSGYIAVSRDVTEQKKTEEKLQRKEQFYRNIIADSMDGLLLIDATGAVVFSSLAAKLILGYEVEDVQGRSCFEFVHPEDIGQAQEAFQKRLDKTAQMEPVVIRLLQKGGNWVWCQMRGNNLLDNPHVRGVVIHFHDDTLRKNAEDALKESEKRFRKLIWEMKTGVGLLDEKGNIVMYNKAAMDMFRLQEEEAQYATIEELFRGAILEDGTPYENGERPIPQVIRTKAPIKDLVLGIYPKQGGELLWILVNVDPVLGDAGQIVNIICSAMDITERKKWQEKVLEEGIKQQKRLTQATIDGQEKERKEIGKELHDNIGQQLTTIKLYLDLAKSTADDSTGDMICLALKNLTEVLNEVRGISRSLVPHTLGDLGLLESIRELADSFTRSQALKIDLSVIDLNEEGIPENKQLMLFRIIQEQLNNIVKHAQALRVQINLHRSPSALLLEIIDDGSGFDPAKTRKGLGLTNISNRVELFNGSVAILSAPGKGCTLRVTIPPLKGRPAVV